MNDTYKTSSGTFKEVEWESVESGASYFLKVYTTPIAKGRPRYSGATNHMYTPKRTAYYEKLLASIWTEAFPDFNICDKAVQLNCTFAFKIPKSAKKSDKTMMASGVIRPTKRPDGDNLMKSVQDALNGVAYEDDSQIVYGRYIKQYAEKPCVEILLVRG